MDAPPMGVLATFTYSSTTSPRDIEEWQQDFSVTKFWESHGCKKLTSHMPHCSDWHYLLYESRKNFSQLCMMTFQN